MKGGTSCKGTLEISDLEETCVKKKQDLNLLNIGVYMYSMY